MKENKLEYFIHNNVTVSYTEESNFPDTVSYYKSNHTGSQSYTAM